MAATFNYVWPKDAWRGGEVEAKARRTAVPGIIIVVKGSGSHRYYTVTHESSGLSCGDYAKLAVAQATAEALGYLLDWTQPDMNRVLSEAGADFRKAMRRIVFARD